MSYKKEKRRREKIMAKRDVFVNRKLGQTLIEN